MERIIYIDHDVFDTNKFLLFAQQVHMESIGTRPFGDPILQPKKWVTGFQTHGS
jgi:hypothetical protein